MAGIRLVRHHRGDRVAAVTAALARADLRRRGGVGLGDVEPSGLLRQVDRGRLVGRERHQRGEKCGSWYDIERSIRHAHQIILEHEVGRAVDLLAV
jgi:hypothetical protein